MEFKYWLLPIISAAVGWFTNYVAVKMIFQPRRRIEFWGLSIQGLLPQRQGQLAEIIGRIVEEELLTHTDIRSAIFEDGFCDTAADVIGRRIDQTVDYKLKPYSILLKNSVARKALQRFKDALTYEAVSLIPDVSDEMMKRIEENIKIRDMVKEKIEKFDMDKFEGIVFKVAQKEFKHIEMFGGMLGFLIGVVQMVLIQLL